MLRWHCCENLAVKGLTPYILFLLKEIFVVIYIVLYCLFIELFLDSKQQCYKDLGFKRYNNILLVPCLCSPGGDSHMEQTGMLVGNFEFNS